MSYDYVLDTFGKFRKGKKTRFTELEERTVKCIRLFLNGEIKDVDFAHELNDIKKQFLEMTERNGESFFDEDTPLWLNSFLYQFLKWRDILSLKIYFEEHPEKLVGEMEERYNDILSMGYERRFMEACRTVIGELCEDKNLLYEGDEVYSDEVC